MHPSRADRYMCVLVWVRVWVGVAGVQQHSAHGLRRARAAAVPGGPASASPAVLPAAVGARRRSGRVGAARHAVVRRRHAAA